MRNDPYSRIYRASILSEVRRRLFEESFPRIKQCLEALPDEDIWYRPNEVSNSVGNLVLHISGNLRQWILGGLGGQEDLRNRPQEFAELGPLPTTQLLALLDRLEEEIDDLLDELSTEHLVATYHIQAFRETGISVLFHAVEHTAYHVGQITYITKWRTEAETNYYGGIDLEEKNGGPAQ